MYLILMITEYISSLLVLIYSIQLVKNVHNMINRFSLHNIMTQECAPKDGIKI